MRKTFIKKCSISFMLCSVLLQGEVMTFPKDELCQLGKTLAKRYVATASSSIADNTIMANQTVKIRHYGSGKHLDTRSRMDVFLQPTDFPSSHQFYHNQLWELVRTNYVGLYKIRHSKTCGYLDLGSNDGVFFAIN